MGLFDEKTEGQKSRDTVPLRDNSWSKMYFVITLIFKKFPECTHLQFELGAGE
jgi:hypothetical protein